MHSSLTHFVHSFVHLFIYSDFLDASKKSATDLGYYHDKYLDYMSAVGGAKLLVRKQPIINRGYYTRVTCFRQIIQHFLDLTKSLGPRQIINIGCGYDTLSFRLIDEGHEDLSIFEVDYVDVIMRKTDMIRRSVELNQLLQGNGNPLGGQNYGFDIPMLKFVAADLQQSTVIEALIEAGLNPNHPTLILSECVLVCKFKNRYLRYPNIRFTCLITGTMCVMLAACFFETC